MCENSVQHVFVKIDVGFVAVGFDCSHCFGFAIFYSKLTES